MRFRLFQNDAPDQARLARGSSRLLHNPNPLDGYSSVFGGQLDSVDEHSPELIRQEASPTIDNFQETFLKRRTSVLSDFIDYLQRVCGCCIIAANYYARVHSGRSEPLGLLHEGGQKD